MKISIRHRKTYSLAVFCVLTSVFLILNGCGDDDDDGAVIPVRHSISGQVTLTGSGLSGVTMTLAGARSDNVITDANGNYTFTGLDNGSYTITPSKTGFTFSPTSSPRTVSGANITAVNFIATPVQPYSISGQVTLTGSGLSGVTMILGGVSNATTITDANGNYTFTGLDNGSYTITPTRTGYTFSPTSSPRTVSGSNISGVHFTATQVPAGPYSISGQVTFTGSGLSGVTLELSGPISATTITDANGNYTFASLDNGSYTIIPIKTGFIFSPRSSDQTVGGANITAVNFIATELSAQMVDCPPSGTTNVTIQDFVYAPQNVTINSNGIVKWTNNGPSPHTVTSGSPGNYSADIYDSGELGTGETFCVQFQGNGTSPYTCTLHPAMVGSVVVQ